MVEEQQTKAEEAIKDEPADTDPQEAAEQEKLRKRADRFGIPYTEGQSKPGQPQKGLSGQRTKRVIKKEPREGFQTGIDLFTTEEFEKREERASRFGVQNAALSYAPLIDKDEDKKRERAARFGTEYQATDHSGLQNEDLWEDRKERGAAVERRPDAIHLYGVDVMNTQEVLSYFEDYGPTRVEWIDDSSCNVTFSSPESAKRAIVALGRPFQAGEAPDLQGLDPADINNLPFLWHKGRDFTGGGRSVPLIYRMATVEDKKGMEKTKASRFLWVKNGQRPRGSQAPGQKRGYDEDGDVLMVREHKPRGGKKISRKKRRGPNGKEIEMKDAQDEETIKAEYKEIASANLASTDGHANSDATDLRKLLSKRRSHEADSAGGRLFSAAAAGILPKILMPRGQDDHQMPTDERIESDNDIIISGAPVAVQPEDDGVTPMED